MMAADVLFVAANIAVLAFIVQPKSLAVFFAASLTFLVLRDALPQRLSTVSQAIGIVSLILLLLYYRSSSLLFNDTLRQWVAAHFPGQAGLFSTTLLAALGVSYCFLRAIYALRDRSVTLWSFARYYFFAPTFFSGPIITPTAFAIERFSMNRRNLLEGGARVVYGVLKFIASSALQLLVPLATLHHAVLALQSYPWWWLWLTLFATGFWLYLNFSAFADIAIGVGRVLGFRVPENFNNPFAATDLTDFWRRWHITLGDWLRANIFNPLARRLGVVLSRNSILVAIASALFTMIVCGLWHQTTPAFLAWGAMHGVGLGLHQAWRRYLRPLLADDVEGQRWYVVASWAVTHVFVNLSWVLFFPVDAPSFEFRVRYAKRLFGLE